MEEMPASRWQPEDFAGAQPHLLQVGWDSHSFLRWFPDCAVNGSRLQHLIFRGPLTQEIRVDYTSETADALNAAIKDQHPVRVFGGISTYRGLFVAIAKVEGQLALQMLRDDVHAKYGFVTAFEWLRQAADAHEGYSAARAENGWLP